MWTSPSTRLPCPRGPRTVPAPRTPWAPAWAACVGAHAMNGSIVSRNTSAVKGLAMRNSAPALLRLCAHRWRTLGRHERERRLVALAPQGLAAGRCRVISGMFQSDSTKSGCEARIFVSAAGTILGLLNVPPVVTRLPERADHDLPHHAAIVGDDDLHGRSPLSILVRRGRGPRLTKSTPTGRRRGGRPSIQNTSPRGRRPRPCPALRASRRAA